MSDFLNMLKPLKPHDQALILLSLLIMAVLCACWMIRDAKRERRKREEHADIPEWMRALSPEEYQAALSARIIDKLKNGPCRLSDEEINRHAEKQDIERGESTEGQIER